MKAVQIALLVLVCACYAQAFMGWVVRRTDGLFDEVADIVDTLDDNVEHIRTHVANLSEGLSAAINKTYEDAQDNVENLIKELGTRMERAGFLALSFGLDTSDCAFPENSIETIVNDIFSETRECITKHKETSESVQDEGLALVDELEDMLEIIEAAFRECDKIKDTDDTDDTDDDKADAVECLVKQISPYMTRAKTLKKRSLRASTKLVSLLKKVGVQIAKCASSSVLEQAGKATKLVSAAVSCIQKKVFSG